MEAAKQSGMSTGIVVTSKVTDATPASFCAHNDSRKNENEIAEMEIGIHPLGTQVDILLGGGRCHFVPQSTPNNGSSRKDERNLLSEAEKLGYTILNKKDDLSNMNVKSILQSQSPKVLGLFSRKSMAFDIDRETKDEPSLAIMTKKTLEFLDAKTANSDKGFFLLVEGSRVDTAGHSNDSAAHYQDIIAYNNAIAVALEYVKKNPNTLLISVSDHETGGLTLGVQYDHEMIPEYMWDPAVIHRVKRSSSYLAHLLIRIPLAKKAQFIRERLFPKYLGINNPRQEEMIELLNLNTPTKLEFAINKIVNRRARIGWTTHGHSGVDVNLYAAGYQSDKFVGNFENTDISHILADILKLDVQEITKKLEPLKKIYSSRAEKLK